MQTKRRTFFLSALIVATAMATLPLTASADPNYYHHGVRHFKAKKYRAAAKFFRQHTMNAPNDPLARYYLANCLVYLRRHPEAITEYRRSYQIDPFSVVSEHCRQALISYNVALPDITANPGLEPIAVEEPAETPPEAGRQGSGHVDSAVAMIRRQAADEKVRNHEYAEDLSDNAIKTGKRKAQQIREEAKQRIKDLYERGLVRNRQGQGIPIWALRPFEQDRIRQRAEQIREQAEEEAKLEESLAQERSHNYKAWSEKRRDALDSVASNLETQLKSRKTKQGVALNPVGTGLYVRNYKTTNKKIPEARQGVARIVDRHYDEARDYTESDGLDGIYDSQEHEERVTGKLAE